MPAGPAPPARRARSQVDGAQAGGPGCCSGSGREGGACAGSGVPPYWWISNLKAGNNAQAAENKLQNGPSAAFATA